jgi:hypothetical protein
MAVDMVRTEPHAARRGQIQRMRRWAPSCESNEVRATRYRPPLDEFDVLVIPGGPGTRALERDSGVASYFATYPKCLALSTIDGSARWNSRPMHSFVRALLPAAVFLTPVASVHLTACGAPMMGSGSGSYSGGARAPAACGGELCQLGEYCDVAKNACAPGCQSDSTCNPGSKCVKSSPDAMDVGACEGGAAAQEPGASGPTLSTSPAEGGGAAPVASSGGAPAATGGGACQATGKTCKIRPDCGRDHHCADGVCYPDAEGCPCKVTLDCGKDRHCTNNICYGNRPGQPCTQQLDCGGSKNHCEAGMCVVNSTGAGCKVRLDCPLKNHCWKNHSSTAEVVVTKT